MEAFTSGTLAEPEKKNMFSSVLSWLIDGYWPIHERFRDCPITIQSPARIYTLAELVAVGDVAEIHLATAVQTNSQSAPEPQYLLKVSRFPGADRLLNKERSILANLRATAGDTTYRKYLPTLLESFQANDKFLKRVNVYRHELGWYTLEQVHEQHAALGGKHLAWIFKRLLTVLGFCHRQGTIHGAVLPCHVMIHAANHGLQLVGWGHSTANGQPIKTMSRRYADWYPQEVLEERPAAQATDLFLAARCMIYLAGGDPVCNWMPHTVPAPLQAFIKTCLLPRSSMRPDDAWALYDELDVLLRRLYGPPKFHDLIMT
jgi:hypothetical protein